MNVTMIKANTIEWNQRGHKIIMSLFDIPFGSNVDKLANLFNELCSKNVMFSLYLSYEKQQLIVYRKHNLEKDFKEKERNLFDYLLAHYSLLPSTDFSKLFLNSFKIEPFDSNFKLIFEDGTKTYLFAYLLTAIKSEAKTFSSKFTQILHDLINSKLVSITISSHPYVSKSEFHPMWGLMITSQSNDKEDLISKHNKFKHFLKNLPSKVNTCLLPITKKDLIRHNANFRLLVPWIKQNGFFFDFVNIIKIIKREKKEDNVIFKVMEPSEIKIQEPNLSTHPAPKMVDILPRKTLPSIKTMSDIPEIKIEKSPSQFIPGNINDIIIPSPRSLNAVFDTEYLKVRLNTMFKELDFKETVIFEDIFDLVLRKGSYYIFIKFYKDIFDQNQAYKIVENLSSIAGLRNQFLCIVVADVIEEGSTKLLNEFNILHLTLSDVLLDDKLKTKLYNTVIA